MSTETKTLRDLQVGDKVVETAGGIRSIRKVEKITKAHGGTLIIDGSAYDMNWGHRRGQTWTQATVEPATEEIERQVARERRKRILAARLNDLRWFDCDLETLERVEAALKGES